MSDIAESVRNGDYSRALKASFYTGPFKATHLFGYLLVTPSVLVFGIHYVPWRHKVVPYTDNQLLWRNGLGAILFQKLNIRIYFGTMVVSWALDSIRKKIMLEENASRRR